jgi:hypothetical protein
VGAQAVIATLNGLRSSEIYHYRLTATNSAGAGIGIDKWFFTPGCIMLDTPPPIIRMYPGMHPGITVSNQGGFIYVIQRNADLTNTNGWTTVASFTLTNGATLWVDTNVNAALPANAQYFYQVLRKR